MTYKKPKFQVGDLVYLLGPASAPERDEFFLISEVDSESQRYTAIPIGYIKEQHGPHPWGIPFNSYMGRHLEHVMFRKWGK